MKKSLFIFLMALSATFSAGAALTADWRIHMSYDDWPIAVYDTPGRVYFAGRTFESNPYASGRDVNSYSLFYYDKKGNEILSVNTVDGASGNAVECLQYNPAKGYLLVVYTDQNIDFIYDDGKIVNLPTLMYTSIPGKKHVNGISFDPANSRAYLATNFGYVVINDSKHEVAESRNYGQPLSGVAKCGDNIVIVENQTILLAPEKEMRYNLSDYQTLEEIALRADEILPMEGGAFLGLLNGVGGNIILYSPDGEEGWKRQIMRGEDFIYNHQYTSDGYSVSSKQNAIHISKPNKVVAIEKPGVEWSIPASFIDDRNLWTLTSRKGLRHYTREGNTWTLVADYMRPNAPATYMSTATLYHPKYGILAASNGMEGFFFDTNQQTPSNLSALKGGFWKEYSPVYTNPSTFSQLRNYYGLSVDPNDTKYVYSHSLLGGFMRTNLEDPDDVMIFANAKNQFSGYKGFVEAFPTQQAWNILCKVTLPKFDNDGRMWTAYFNYDVNKLEIKHWSAADRKATTSKQTYRPLKSFTLQNYTPTNTDVMTVLKHPQNKNILAIGNQYDYAGLYLYNHNGTPEVTNDDKVVYVHFPVDQDGGNVNFLGINATVEDPETGLLWILSERGPFIINPVSAFENPNSVSRIKVARNDGTNLADYLLNEVNVYCMAIDGEKRKWFGTANGIVCTSSDGKTILAEFTPENSPLPSDDVYAACFNPDNGSIMLGTDAGLVELFPSGSGAGSSADSSGVRIYPNPVEPDFYGWVRIDNVAEGSLVKITDAQGGVVKEIGPVHGGSVEWDVTGFNNRRVSTGVYYVLVSPGSAGGQSSVNKILVLN